MFLDEAIITVQGGSGGRGTVAWRREKYVPRGGPNGGDGGRGGDVILLADENADTLSDYASRKRFEAPKGDYGGGNNRCGHNGEDLILKVPTGTYVMDVATEGHPVVADLSHNGDRIVIAHGGRGGYGNAHFKTSTRQGPDFAELGEPGEKRAIKLELKLVADVGIIGYPSVGKSTLISVISSAKPKIADYPFTTLIPNLGVVTVHERPAGRSHGGGRSYVVCDVPGLIEGASEGKGLGDAFLKHIERCGALVHMLDISRALESDGTADSSKLIADYKAIRKELEAYSKTLSAKREIVVLNKADLVANETKDLERALKKAGIHVILSISAATRGGTEELKKLLLPVVLEERQKREDITDKEREELPVLKPHLVSDKMGAYRIEEVNDAIKVTGRRLEQFTSMTNFGNESAVRRFRDVIERIGLLKAIEKIRKAQDSAVFIGETRVDQHL